MTGCLAALVFLSFSNCRREEAQESPLTLETKNAQLEDAVILKIEDTSYFNSDFGNYVRSMVGDELSALSHESLSRLLDNFIEEKLLLTAAKKSQVSLTWEEKKEYLVKLRNESWSEETEESIDESEYKNLFDRLLIEKYTYQLIKDIETDEEEIKAYYDLQKREFLKPERVEVSQILLKTEDKAIAILERLKGETIEGFQRIAREESAGIEASRGGKMGLFEMGELPYEMEKVVFALKEGKLSRVVESSYGYHIFRLDRRFEPELIPLEEASSSIRVKIVDQKIKQFMIRHIQELKDKTVWSFFPQNLPFPYQRNSR